MRERPGVLRLQELRPLIRGRINVRYVGGKCYSSSNIVWLKVNLKYEKPPIPIYNSGLDQILYTIHTDIN